MAKLQKKTNKRSKPYLVGITGSFGTGKSTIGDILKTVGICVIDTDDIVRTVLNKKNYVTRKIINVFGGNVLSKKKKSYIDKKVLAQIVFANKIKRKELESIVHPYVNNELKKFILKYKNEQILAVLIPLLFECHYENMFDEIWCVKCKKNILVKRLTKIEFDLSDINNRLSTQLDQDKKANMSTFVIDNSKKINDTKTKVLNRINQLVARLDRNPHLSFDIWC